MKPGAELVTSAPLHLHRPSAELRQPRRIHLRGDDRAGAKTAADAHSVDHHLVPVEAERVGEGVADKERILGPCPDLQPAALAEPGDGCARFDRRHVQREEP